MLLWLTGLPLPLFTNSISNSTYPLHPPETVIRVVQTVVGMATVNRTRGMIELPISGPQFAHESQSHGYRTLRTKALPRGSYRGDVRIGPPFALACQRADGGRFQFAGGLDGEEVYRSYGGRQHDTNPC